MTKYKRRHVAYCFAADKEYFLHEALGQKKVFLYEALVADEIPFLHKAGVAAACYYMIKGVLQNGRQECNADRGWS